MNPRVDPRRYTDPGLVASLQRATLGKYDVLGPLGAGGMAIVFAAHDLRLNRKVAIKVMAPEVARQGDAPERFRREAQTAAGLSHPNIIPIYDVGETDEIAYFVMKFVAGRAIDSIILEEGPLPIDIVRTVLSKAAKALGYAHRSGVIHRDVKPGNVMIDEEGWVLVTDFGLAKAQSATTITEDGTTVGTAAYMSPEQCFGTQELTGASDQYSLGVMAFEMLTGRVPFMAENPLAVMLQHIEQPPPPIEQSRPDCPVDLRKVVQRMLAKDPARRFAGMEGVVDAVGSAGLAPDSRRRMIRWAKMGTGAIIDKLPGTPASPLQLGASTERRRHTPPRRRALIIAALISVIVAAATYWAVVDGPLSSDEGVNANDVPASTPTQLDAARQVDEGNGRQAKATTGVTDSIPEVVTRPQRPPPAPTPGEVAIVGLPEEGTVILNGRSRPRNFEIAPGSYVLELSAPGYQSTSDTIRVVSGELQRVTFAAQRIPAAQQVREPRQSTGVLQLRISPAADLSVNGVSVRQTSRYVDTLTAGRSHYLVFHREGYQPKDTTITLVSGRVLTLNIVLERFPNEEENHE